MNAITILNNNNELRADSRDIAVVLDVQHKNVLALVRGYQNDFEDLGKVAFETRALDSGQKETLCLLNEDQCYFLLTLVRNSKKTVEAKKQLVIAFAEARKKLNNQVEMTEQEIVNQAFLIIHKQNDELKQKNLQLEEKIEQDAPKIVLAEALLESDSGIRITDFVRASSDTYGLERNKMYVKLREWKILDYKNQPYQRCIDAGWFYTVERPFTNGDFSWINIQVFVTSKGQKYVINRLCKEGILEKGHGNG